MPSRNTTLQIRDIAYHIHNFIHLVHGGLWEHWPNTIYYNEAQRMEKGPFTSCNNINEAGKCHLIRIVIPSGNCLYINIKNLVIIAPTSDLTMQYPSRKGIISLENPVILAFVKNVGLKTHMLLFLFFNFKTCL